MMVWFGGHFKFSSNLGGFERCFFHVDGRLDEGEEGLNQGAGDDLRAYLQ